MIGGRGGALRVGVTAGENGGDTDPEETKERTAVDTSALRAGHAD